ncbi:MAG: TonB-dependent receptor [Chitinophagaceae bacterium]|nr:TonB-dependent receptor [Chitinophagaceae bacterium]
MRIPVLLLIAILFSLNCFSQKIFNCVVKDAETGQPLSNVSILANGGHPFTATRNDGTAKMLMPNGRASILFTAPGFKIQTLELVFPLTNPDTVFTITMEKETDVVIIYSFRTNSRLEKTPTRTEVLDAEKVTEESSIKSSHIANLMNDVTGVHVQQTSAVTNHTELRIQGLPGRYTQLLRDGMPLFGGYAGSFSILQVPPLDLHQIEIVKGSNSALYGGGAVAGLVNIISKKPIQGKRERFLLFNQSTLRESNLHIYLSEKAGKVGYTFFTGASYQRQEDVNNDGFSDLGRTESIFIHPTFFFYPNEKNTISLGISSNYDDRIGGDMEILSGYYNNFHQFFIQNQTFRNTVDIIWENTINSTDKFTLKGTTSSFNRNISTAVFGMKAKQLSYFSEASYSKKITKHHVIAGMNLTGENLDKKLPDSTFITDYNHFAVGLFLQDDWRINSKLTIETGFRTDFHNIYKAFLLPRFSVLYKMSRRLTLRFGGGIGYRIPSIFTSDIDERDYRKLLPLDSISIRPERSQGLNLAINYHRSRDKGNITFNQSFFITNIQDPIINDTTMNGRIYFHNAARPVVTYGSETFLQLHHNALELYLGYAYTVAKKLYDPAHLYVSLSPRNKLTGMISYQLSKKFRTSVEATYTSQQYLDNGIQTPSYPFAAAMIRYDVGHFSFVLNCENIFDYRQTNEEDILIPPVTDPRFKQLWAPIDGRVVNLSIKIRL